jgi:hypothetical protein
MTEIQSSSNPQFFGKMGLTPFIGVIEDVNDPKQAGRVKVRAVGWNPTEKKGEDGLSTDDLPWARVSAPTTHAQQSRVGSKHGLLPGCWVWGFFLDDDEAQKPMVCGSFPFTAKAADKDNRQIDAGAESTPGRQSDDIEAFSLVDASGRGPNTQTRTEKERGSGRAASDPADPAAAAPSLDDSTTNECGELISANTKAKRSPLKKGEQGNNNSQVYPVSIADGACGTIAHGTEDIQRMMMERMPSAFSRFAYGDMVWNKFTGSHLNINGIMAQMSLDICAIIRMILTQLKAFQEENINRPTKGAMCLAATERDGPGNLIADETTTIKDDIFHTIFTMLMEQMCGQVFDMLKDIDNGGDSGGNNQGDNNDGGGGGGLRDPGAPCVTDQIMQNISVMANEMIQRALRESEELLESYNRKEYRRIEMTYRASVREHLIEEDTLTGSSDFTLSQYIDILEDVIDEFEEEDERQKSEMRNIQSQFGDSSSGSEGNEFSDVLSMLGSVGNILQFSSMSKYAMIGAKTHNRSGNATQDERLRDGGCKMERIYNTVEGVSGSMMGGMSGGLGGIGGTLEGALGLAGSLGGGNGSGGGNGRNGSGRGSRGDGSGERFGSDRMERIANLGFGGLDSRTRSEFSNTTCETLIGRNPGNGVGDGTGGGGTGGIGNGSGGNGSGGSGSGGTGFSGDGSGSNVVGTPGSVPIGNIGTGTDGTGGLNGDAFAISLPSGDPCLADNFRHGTPTNVIVTNHGKNYRNYPLIFIPEYNGTPVPVINSSNGEIIAILTNCKSWNPNVPNPGVSILPDNGGIGIDLHNNDDYDLVLGGIFVGNIGSGYCNPRIEVIDRDTLLPNGEVKPVVIQERIVDAEIINSGQGFKRIPKLNVIDDCGMGAKLYPIMSVVPRPRAKEYPIPVMMIYCPSKNQRNYQEN